MTGKEIQREINEAVLREIKEFQNDGALKYVSRLRTCTAHVYETENFFILISYVTTVAIINKNTKIGFDFLRYVYVYTSTSAHHISKFFKDYGAKMAFTYR